MTWFTFAALNQAPAHVSCCAGFRTPAMAGLSTGSIGRRPKSAKAGNRGVWGTNGAAGAMGIWRRRECWGSCVDAVDRIALARITGPLAWKQPALLHGSCGIETPPTRLPPLAKQVERVGRQHNIAVLAALGLLDPNDLLRAVDVLDLQPDHLAGAQAAAIAETEQYAHLEAARDREHCLLYTSDAADDLT